MNDNYSLNEVISGSIEFARERNILNQGANDFRRLSYTLEEEIERYGLENDKVLSRIEAVRRLEQWDIWKNNPPETRNYLPEGKIEEVMEKYKHKVSKNPDEEQEYLEHQIDASVDKIIYEVGEMAKTIHQCLRFDEVKSVTDAAKAEIIEGIICEAFNVVMQANKTKWSKTDSLGQVTKDESFKSPNVLEKGLVHKYWWIIEDKN